jgi:hypothetical protein
MKSDSIMVVKILNQKPGMNYGMLKPVKLFGLMNCIQFMM